MTHKKSIKLKKDDDFVRNCAVDFESEGIIGAFDENNSIGIQKSYLSLSSNVCFLTPK